MFLEVKTAKKVRPIAKSVRELRDAMHSGTRVSAEVPALQNMQIHNKIEYIVLTDITWLKKILSI